MKESRQIAAAVAAEAQCRTELTRALQGGARGALLLSAVAVGLMLLAWVAFYFLIFLSRGPIG